MLTKPSVIVSMGGRSIWSKIGRFVLLVGLAAAAFLLVQSMVHHRFFRGWSYRFARYSQTIDGF
jgi:hypothetical protein